MNVASVRKYFIDEVTNGNFVLSRDGSKTVELIGASFVADEDAIFGRPNDEYIEREIRWYDSQSLDIKGIYGGRREPPAAWVQTANQCGRINSNYGYLIYNDRNYNQYNNVLCELQRNPNSRRASMIYQRPSIWHDHSYGGRNDFICTNAVTYYIRGDELHAVVQMRSNDVVFGYKNDVAWQREVLSRLANDLNCKTGTITWQVQNLHVYERHFHLIK